MWLAVTLGHQVRLWPEGERPLQPGRGRDSGVHVHGLSQSLLPSISVFLAVPYLVFLCPQPRGCGLSPEPCWWEVEEALACMCAGSLVSTCARVCWRAQVRKGRARHGVGRLLSGDRQGLAESGQLREVAGLLAQPHHRDRCFSFFMPSEGSGARRGPCLCGSTSRSHSQSSPAQASP